MANNAYICRVRSDIPAGTMQVTDLHPNTSQASGVYAPVTQSGYVPAIAENDTVAALVANKTVASHKGLAAYLIANVIDAGGATITVAVANNTAVDLIALKDAGSAITLTVVNAQLVANGAGAGTELNTGGSTGSLASVLKILGGGKFTLPSGSTVGGLAAGSGLGSFNDDGYRQIYSTGSLQLSCGEGVLSKLASATFSYNGSAGRAVVVYDASGNVLA